MSESLDGQNTEPTNEPVADIGSHLFAIRTTGGQEKIVMRLLEARIKMDKIDIQSVVLLTDLTENTQKGYDRNPDDEERLFYVGATRTKETLHIVRPKDIYKGYKI